MENVKQTPQYYMKPDFKGQVKTWAANSAAIFEWIFLPFTMIALSWLYVVRRVGNHRLPGHRWAYRKLGVYPIRNHYYEPLFDTPRLSNKLGRDRELPGIDWNADGQRAMLKNFTFQNDLKNISLTPTKKREYYFYNDTFGPGDSEYLYNMIRFAKPQRIVEIGSGNSTLMAVRAIQDGQRLDPSYRCEMICVEPYERPWLKEVNVKLVRDLVENVDRSVFTDLKKGDILFIDSSHIIRPHGDVLCEFLQLLPTIASGVYVHVHDIFTPKDYPNQWLNNEMKLWNEQYLLEAFLSHNNDFRIIGALNWLKHHHPQELGHACPVFGEHSGHFDPASFWMVRN